MFAVLAVQPTGSGRVVAGVEAGGLPVIQGAMLDSRRFGDVEVGDGFLRLHEPQESKRAVQGGHFGVAGDDGELARTPGQGPDDIAFVADRCQCICRNIVLYRP
jgi:hypothetical protein